MEGLADLYYQRLKDEKNPGLILTKFYCELFELPFAPNLIAQLNKLVKIYGRDAVFYSILDIASSDRVDHARIFGLINYICKKRFERKADGSTHDLTNLVEAQSKKVTSIKRHTIVIRSPFDD